MYQTVCPDVSYKNVPIWLVLYLHFFFFTASLTLQLSLFNVTHLKVFYVSVLVALRNFGGLDNDDDKILEHNIIYGNVPEIDVAENYKSTLPKKLNSCIRFQ